MFKKSIVLSSICLSILISSDVAKAVESSDENMDPGEEGQIHVSVLVKEDPRQETPYADSKIQNRPRGLSDRINTRSVLRRIQLRQKTFLAQFIEAGKK